MLLHITLYYICKIIYFKQYLSIKKTVVLSAMTHPPVAPRVQEQVSTNSECAPPPTTHLSGHHLSPHHSQLPYKNFPRQKENTLVKGRPKPVCVARTSHNSEISHWYNMPCKLWLQSMSVSQQKHDHRQVAGFYLISFFSTTKDGVIYYTMLEVMCVDTGV